MPLDDHQFFGKPLSYGIQGFAIIAPGETATGPFYVVGPIDDAVKITTGVSLWGGSISGKTIRVSVFGYFETITVDPTSTGTLIAYRTN